MKKKALTKVLALAMAVAMTGSLIACGNDAGDQSSQQSSESTQEESQGGQEESSNESEESSTEDPGEETPESADQPLPEWEAYDCNGATIRIAAEQIFDATREEDKDGDRKNDYVQKWEYLHALEKKYNCKFEIVTLENSQGVDEAEAILNGFTNGQGYADIFMKGPGVMLQIRNFLATVEDRDKLKMGNAFIDAASWNGVDYGFTYDNIGECFVLCYNREYLKEVGMQKTPGDLFKEGKWSYADAKDYFTELQSKLPEGSYAIAVECYNYAFMAGGTNGVMGISPNGDINLYDEKYITALNYYKELMDAGVAAPITGYTEGPDNTIVTADDASMFGSILDLCGYAGANTHVIGNVQNWQHVDPAGDKMGRTVDWGIVPYPWGPECEVTGFDEKGLPILSNYFVARVDFTNVLVSAAEYRGEGSKDIPDWVLFQIVREYEDMRSTQSTTPAGTTPGSGSGQAWINAYTAEKNGEPAGNVSFSPYAMNKFTQMEDVDIWNWLSSNVKIDYCKALSDAGLVRFSRNSYLVLGAGKDAKAAGEAIKTMGEATLKDQGLK